MQKERIQDIKTKVTTKESSGRALVLVVICFVVLLLILVRLSFVQIIHGSVYRAQAERMYNGNAKASSDRGSIVMLARDGGRYALAGQLSVYHVFLEPKFIKDKESVFAQLEKIFPTIKRGEFDLLVEKGKSNRFPVGFSLEEVTKLLGTEKFSTAMPAGLRIVVEKDRHYPADSLAAHVVGFVGSDGDSSSGRYGLEKFYNDILRMNDQGLYTNFFVELFSNFKSISQDSYSPNGQGTLVTTLEPEIQKHAEAAIAGIYEKWNAETVGIIVMDPSTGAILAMAGNPTFNPNKFQKELNSTAFTNPLTQKVYEVGSIMKPLIVSYGIETGAITPQTKYTDHGSVVVEDRTIYNFDKKARGLVNMEQVLIQSLNTGMVFIMDKMPRKNVRQYFTDLGLRGKSEIDLPYEATGLTKNLDSLRRVEYANIAFGQGLAVTPIAMIRALSAIANYGILVTPHVVSHIEYQYGPTKDFTETYKEKESRVLSVETTDSVTGIMTKLVDTNFVKDPNYSKHYAIAGKTGTAQMAGNSGYGSDRLHTFFGFFPARAPRFSIFMIVTKPQGAKFSAQTLAGPFLELTQFLINYYNIPPDRGLETE